MTTIYTDITSEEINLKPSVEYFPHSAPYEFGRINCFAANGHGDILFGVRVELLPIVDADNVISYHREHAKIAKYQIKSGENSAFTIDLKVTTEDLRRMIKFYVLNDFLGVLVSYNPQDYILKQHLLVFDHKQKIARLTYERTLKLKELSIDVKVGLGEIGRGRILVYGIQGPRNEESAVIAYSLSADPRTGSVEKYPDINLTKQIANFVTLLKADLPNCKIIPAGIFVKDNYMYFLIKHQERSVIALHTIGRMRICETEEESKNTPSTDIYKLLTASGHIRYALGICSFNLHLSAQRGRSVWLKFYLPDYEKLGLSWLLHYITLSLRVKAIHYTLNLAGRIRHFDGGRTLRFVRKYFQWLYGPSMCTSTVLSSLQSGPRDFGLQKSQF